MAVLIDNILYTQEGDTPAMYCAALGLPLNTSNLEIQNYMAAHNIVFSWEEPPEVPVSPVVILSPNRIGAIAGINIFCYAGDIITIAMTGFKYDATRPPEYNYLAIYLDGSLLKRIDMNISGSGTTTFTAPQTLRTHQIQVQDAFVNNGYATLTVYSPAVTRHWITVAEGATLGELRTNAVGKYVDGSFRLVMETPNAPNWMLASGAWLVNALKAPLNAVGVDLEEVKVKDKIIYVYMHGSPHLIPIIIGLFITGLLVLGILYLVTNPKVQQEVTEQAAIELEETETKQEVTDVILEWARETGASSEAVRTLLEVVWAGYTPEKEKIGIDWEKYLKWGLIGGGVILGASVLIPAIIRK